MPYRVYRPIIQGSEGVPLMQQGNNLKLSFFVKSNAKTIFTLFIGVWIIPSLIINFLSPPILLTRALMPMFLLFPVLWVYAIGTNLHNLLPEARSFELNLFRTSIFTAITCLYIFVFFFFGPKMVGSPGQILILLTNACYIYSIYLTSKMLLIVEKSQEVNFHTIGNAFLLFIVFPVGVWFIQPRIQKIFKNNGSA